MRWNKGRGGGSLKTRLPFMDMNTDGRSRNTTEGIHVVAKPIGPVCNLNCGYCFYLEKQALFGAGEKYRMTDEVLSAYIRNYIRSQPTPAVEFVWQGGEPTLLGIDFFKRVVELQRPFARQKTIMNSLQTNGTLLTDEWCAFLKKYNFMVGISLDGPKEIHDRYRRDRKGNGTFDRVMQGLRLLQKHKVEYNVLACVARDTATRPLDVYRFLKAQGVEFIQFTPIVERMPDARSSQLGLRLAGPAVLDNGAAETDVTPWTVIPEEYGDFLIAIYEEWLRHDVGKVFEYETKGFIDFSDAGRLHGHIAIGYHLVAARIEEIEGFPKSLGDQILHLILAHQGKQEQGSPVTPMTREALILYYADELDSKLNAFERIFERENGAGKKWSQYVKLLDRFLYFGNGEPIEDQS